MLLCLWRSFILVLRLSLPEKCSWFSSSRPLERCLNQGAALSNHLQGEALAGARKQSTTQAASLLARESCLHRSLWINHFRQTDVRLRGHVWGKGVLVGGPWSVLGAESSFIPWKIQGGDWATVKEGWKNGRKNINTGGIFVLESNAQQLLWVHPRKPHAFFLFTYLYIYVYILS